MSLDNENLFIVEFIRVYLGNGDIHNLRDLLSCCSLEKLNERAQERDVAAFFHTAICSGKVDIELPDGIMKQWHNHAQINAMRSALYEREGISLSKDFESMGVDFILLKGLSLMEDLYGDTWSRSTSDLDIYIKKDDYDKVKGYFLKNGFTCPAVHDFRGTEIEFREISELYDTEISFIKKIGKITINIDVHWELDGLWDGTPLKDLFPIEEYPWRDYTETAKSGNWKFTRMSMEMQFLHIVYHFALHHQFHGIKWFLDICLYINKFGNTMDWDFIRDMVKEEDCRKVLGITLKMAGEFAGCSAEITPCWEEYWSGQSIAGEYRFYKERLLSDASKSGQYLVYILLPLNFKNKLRVLFYLLFDDGAVHHWRSKQRSRFHAIGQPLYILYRMGAERLKTNR